MGGPVGAVPAAPSLFRASCGVVLMWLVAAAVAHAIAGAVTPAALDVHAGSLAALGVGAALLLVAGVLRLTRGRVFTEAELAILGQEPAD